MKYFGDVAAFIVVVVFLVFAVIFTPIDESGDNWFGFVTHPTYSDYAVPMSSISVDTTLVFNNVSDTASRLFEVTDDIIYRRAYISYDGQVWTPFNLTPVSTINGEWISCRGLVNVAFSPTKLRLNANRTASNNTYIIIYSCSKNTTIHNWSCHDGWQIIKFDARLNQDSSNNYLSVDYLNILSSNAGSNDYFIVTSNIAWTVSSSPSWVKLSKTSGFGNDTVTVVASANTGSQRTGTITLTGTSVPSASLNVTQLEGTTTCTPKTCASFGYDCGSWSDGCTGTINCGTTCPSGQTCSNGVCTSSSTCVLGTTTNCAYCGNTCTSGQTCSNNICTTIQSGTANTYYVSPSGSDSNSGTNSSPWFSLNRAWEENLKPGDTIYMRGGIYRYAAQRLLDKSGTSNNLIKVWAYPGEYPIITRNDDSFVPGWPNALIYFRGDYVHFKGLEIMGNTQRNSAVWPGMRAENSNYCIYELLNLHHNGLGMEIVNEGYTMHSTGNLVLNCDFHHNQDPYTDYDNADGLLFMSITHPEDVNTIRGCRSWWNTDDGYDFDSNEGMLYVENSWAWHNGYIPETFETTSGGDGNGFKLGLAASDAIDQRNTIKRRVSNCLAFDNMAWGFHENGAKQNMELYNCVAYNNGISGTWSGGFHLNVANTPYYIKNNIAYKNVPDDVDLGVPTNVKYNSWNGGVTVSDADFISVSPSGVDGKRQEDGSLPNVDFLKLRSDSDLIDKGTNIGLLYNGNAPDLGAYEYND